MSDGDEWWGGRADGRNHNMDKRGAYRELYEWMTAFLDEKWGRGGTIRGH